MLKQINVRIIIPSKKLFYLIPVPVSKFVALAECPGHEFAIHRPVSLREDRVLIDKKNWCLSEVKTGLQVMFSQGTQDDLKKRAVARIVSIPGHQRGEDIIAKASALSLAGTKGYKEGFLK